MIKSEALKRNRQPAVSQRDLVAQVLGVSISAAFEVMHKPSLPVVGKLT